jgi:hypothetical protein
MHPVSSVAYTIEWKKADAAKQDPLATQRGAPFIIMQFYLERPLTFKTFKSRQNTALLSSQN